MKVRLPGKMGAGLGGMNMNNVNSLMQKAQQAQQDLETASAELDLKEYTASSGGEQVTVTVLGTMKIKNLYINPEIVDPEDSDLLSDMIKGAVNEALRQAKTDRDQTMESISGQMKIPGFPGMF